MKVRARTMFHLVCSGLLAACAPASDSASGTRSDASSVGMAPGDAAVDPAVQDGATDPEPTDAQVSTPASDAGPALTDASVPGDAGSPEPPPGPIDYGSLDRTRMPVEDWRNTRFRDPGGWTTIDVREHGLPANDASVDASEKLTEILASTSGRRRLYFPAGTYTFKRGLSVKASDLWFEGDGADHTVFLLDAPSDLNMELAFTGSAASSPLPVMHDIAVGDASVTLDDASALAPGDLVQLYADNAPLAQGGRAWSLEVYSQLLRVVSVEGNTVRFDMKVLLPYPASHQPRLRRYEPLRNLRVSQLKVQRVRDPSSENVSNLVFRYTDNAQVDHVESAYSGRNHIYFEGSKDCVIRDSYVHDTWKPTTGGYGYGLALVTSTGCLISNNKTSRLRHQIILQTGACHNVVSFNDVQAPTHYNDVALHATFAYFNLFEGNTFHEGVADTSKDGTSVEPSTGPGNTWFRNYVTYRVGSTQGQTQRQNVIGNLVERVQATGTDHYIAANLARGTGAVAWGALSPESTIPASLYLHEKPSFFDSSDPFPVFGPGVEQFGLHNGLPASRQRPTGRPERIDNPGFEAGTSGWTTGSTFSISSEQAHGGTQSLALVGTGAWANTQQTVSVQPNTRYTWSLWGRSTSDGGRLKVLAGTSELCGLKTTPSAAPALLTWQHYYCHFDSGSHTSVRLYIGDGGGTHYFDDSQLY